MTTATAHPRVAAVAAARDTGARGTMDRPERIEALACADLYRAAPPLAEVRGFFGGAPHAVSADPDSGDGATEFFRAHGYVVDYAWDKFARAPEPPPPMGGDLAVRTADPADDRPGPSYRNMLRLGFQPVYRRENLRSPDTHDG